MWLIIVLPVKEGKNYILVTGGAGYIGSHVCKALSRVGFEPVVFDSLVYGHKWAVQWGHLVKGDIVDIGRLDEVVSYYKPIAVMHFAAYAYVGESVENPSKYYTNNVAGTLNLLNTMLRHEVKHIVFSSTCATYGVPEYVPIEEEHPQKPINPYGAGKLMVERMLSDFDTAYNLRSVALRYFNAAGADQDCQIGEVHDPETHLIPLALDVALGKRQNLCIYGNDYDTLDGTCVRDYIHVEDLASAHILALQYLLSGGTSKSYNLGNGSGFSVMEVIDSVKKITGKEIETINVSRRPGDPPVLVGSSARIKQELGWLPVFKGLDDIIASAWRWHQHFYADLN